MTSGRDGGGVTRPRPVTIRLTPDDMESIDIVRDWMEASLRGLPRQTVSAVIKFSIGVARKKAIEGVKGGEK